MQVTAQTLNPERKLHYPNACECMISKPLMQFHHPKQVSANLLIGLEPRPRALHTSREKVKFRHRL